MYHWQCRFLIVLCIAALAQSCAGRFYIGYDRTDTIQERRQMVDREARR